MSTEFASTLEAANDYSNFDENVRFVRWAGRPEDGTETATGRCCYEFGTMTNFLGCKALADMGSDWFGPGSALDETDAGTVAWFDRLVREGRATFGRFGITVALGSGTATRFTTEDPA